VAVLADAERRLDPLRRDVAETIGRAIARRRPGQPEQDGLHPLRLFGRTGRRDQHFGPRPRVGGFELEPRERERSGIPSLKVGFNKVFGYYIEVTHANTRLVPVDYIRKQTLTNAERYITPELKEYETLILNAEERILQIERRCLPR
jgi:DNA mismatch repair protein MutS